MAEREGGQRRQEGGWCFSSVRVPDRRAGAA